MYTRMLKRKLSAFFSVRGTDANVLNSFKHSRLSREEKSYGKPQGTRSRGCVFRASLVLTCPVNFSGHVVIFRGSWLRSGEKYR